MKRRLAWGLCLALAGGSTALAADDEQGDVNVFLKGGVGGLTGELSDTTQSGPTYGVALSLQPWNVVGLELAYDGSRLGINDARVASDSALVMNGGTAMVKLGLPFLETVKPFVAGGVGASWVTVTGGGDGIYENDLVEQIPLAAGLEFNTGALTAGVRGTYRYLLDEDFGSPSTAVGAVEPEGNLVEGQLTIGGRF
jgi:opacity protein-like surface antigen